MAARPLDDLRAAVASKFVDRLVEQPKPSTRRASALRAHARRRCPADKLRTRTLSTALSVDVLEQRPEFGASAPHRGVEQRFSTHGQLPLQSVQMASIGDVARDARSAAPRARVPAQVTIRPSPVASPASTRNNVVLPAPFGSDHERRAGPRRARNRAPRTGSARRARRPASRAQASDRVSSPTASPDNGARGLCPMAAICKGMSLGVFL